MKKLTLLVFIFFQVSLCFGQNGVYGSSSGSYATIANFGPSLALFHSDGRINGLKQTGNEIKVGKTLGNTNDEIGSINFLSAENKLTVHYSDGTSFTGIKAAILEKKIEFKNGKQKLAGELLLPEGKGPFATVVLTHGSGEETRESSRALGYLFAANGIAALIYDKRGCGESSGKEWRASFNDYANDLLAAVNYLQAIPEINKTRIGLYGHSQGGWVVPVAYSLQPASIAFCIISAANAVSPVEENLYAGNEEMKLAGLDENSIAEVNAFRKIKYEVGITGNGLEEYKKTTLPAAESKAWFKYTGGGLPDNIFWKENGYYQPEKALRSINCPVLVLYAAHDISTDSKTQLPLMQSLLPVDKATFKLFDNANHMMLQVPSKGFSLKQIPLVTKMAEGYIETIINWSLKTTQ